MKTETRILNQIILILIFGLIMITASAQDKHQGQGGNKISREQGPPPQPPTPPEALPAPPPPPPPPPPPDEEFVQGRPGLDLPDITSDQHEKIRKTDLRNMSEMTPLRNQMREKRARLSTILTTMPVDQKQADQIADEIGKTAAAMLKLQIRHDQDLRNILTADQQVIFDSRPKPWLNRKP